MPTFSSFSLVPSVVIIPSIVYCNDCGAVVIQSLTAKHNCNFVRA